MAHGHGTRRDNANETFLGAYIACALWSSTDDKDRPLDANYTRWEIAPETRTRMFEDCQRFETDNTDLLARYYEALPLGRDASGEWTPEAQAGHDFWLSRNGHGAGFFDRDVPDEIKDALQERAQAFGTYDLYVGDDGQIYGM